MDYLLLGNFLLEKKDQKPLDKEIDWLKEFELDWKAVIRNETKQLKTGERELRKFGLWVGAALVVLGLLFLLRHKTHYPYLLWPGVALTAFGAARPRALKYVYLAWMTLAIVLGFVVSPLVLTLFFFLVMTPVGLAARSLGKDFLSRKVDRTATTYWIQRERKGPKPPIEYEWQY